METEFDTSALATIYKQNHSDLVRKKKKGEKGEHEEGIIEQDRQGMIQVNKMASLRESWTREGRDLMSKIGKQMVAGPADGNSDLTMSEMHRVEAELLNLKRLADESKSLNDSRQQELQVMDTKLNEIQARDGDVEAEYNRVSCASCSIY